MAIVCRSVRTSVCLAVCHTRGPCLNGSTYRNVFAPYDRAMLDAQSLSAVAELLVYYVTVSVTLTTLNTVRPRLTAVA